MFSQEAQRASRVNNIDETLVFKELKRTVHTPISGTADTHTWSDWIVNVLAKTEGLCLSFPRMRLKMKSRKLVSFITPAIITIAVTAAVVIGYNTHAHFGNLSISTAHASSNEAVFVAVSSRNTTVTLPDFAKIAAQQDSAVDCATCLDHHGWHGLE